MSMVTLKVDLKERSYPIFIGSDILAKFGEMSRLYGLGHKLVVITDRNVAKHYGDAFNRSLQDHADAHTIVLKPGEEAKNLKNVEKVIAQMLDFGCDRNSAVVGFGGGVVGDLAGFVASVYKRGVSYAQVPTTLLAQVDASVGGKTGVNHSLGKNMIGTFYQPRLVWADLTLLHTLPRRELVCGLAEILKYGMIRDAELFASVVDDLEALLNNVESELLTEVVRRCCAIKAEIVAIDERESDVRMILNFGHTVGHALEVVTGYKVLNHGEAVLLGMLAESQMATALGLLSTTDFDRLRGAVKAVGLEVNLGSISAEDVLKAMQSDKKAVEGRLRMVLPTRVGEVVIRDDVKPRVIREGLEFVLEGRWS